MARPPKVTQPYPEQMLHPLRALRVGVLDGDAVTDEVETQEETLHIGSADGNDLVVKDPTVSRYHVELERRDEGIAVLDHGSTNGTFIGAARVERAVVPPGTTIRIGQTRLRVEDGKKVEVAVEAGSDLGALRGSMPIMRRLFTRIRKAAKSQVAVLLVGESGTGKEVIARSLHEHSPRKSGPFVTVDCASLTPTLVASELFGHEKGAFTGADRRHQGAFERAHGGTIFLDEIGELPESLQPQLLGVLERRRFRRLGGRDEIEVDVRLVSATNRDLRAEVNAGAFRLDLYYRIAVVRMAVPPLRERVEDIPLLAEHFLREAGETAPMTEVLDANELSRMARHHWPGNVRELRNYVEAFMAMGEAPGFDESPERSASSLPAGPHIDLLSVVGLPYKEARGAVLGQFESHYLPHVLERADGNVSQAARDCAMDRSHLWDLLRRHKLR